MKAISSDAIPITTMVKRLNIETTAVGLAFITTLISRLVFITHYLYHWDSVNFAFSIFDFNLVKEQPQPPGYILYVWLIRLVNWFFHDPQSTMALISVASSAAAIIAIFFLGKSLFNARVGAIAAVFLGVSPLFWFYGEIALPHTLDTFLVIFIAWCLYETIKGNEARLIPAMIVLGIAGGIRQQTPFFLAGILLFALYKVSWKKRFIALAVTAGVCFIWFIPLIASNGGLMGYLHILAAFSARFDKSTAVSSAGLSGLSHNLGKLIPYTLYGMGFSSVAFIGIFAKRYGSFQWKRNWEKGLFLGLWIIPSMAFYVFVHMGQQGLVFTFLPALILIAAASLNHFFQGQLRPIILTSTAIALLSIAFFYFFPEYPFGATSQRFLTRATLVNSDQYFKGRLDAIQGNFTPTSTIILAANWHHVQFYLPDYQLFRFGVGKGGIVDDTVQETISGDSFQGSVGQLGLQPDQSGKIHLIIFDPVLARFNLSSLPNQQIQLADGEKLIYFDLAPSDTLTLSDQSYQIVHR